MDNITDYYGHNIPSGKKVKSNQIILLIRL